MTSKPNQRVCILGANGFIGSHLSLALVRKGHKVIGLDLHKYRLTSLLNDNRFSFYQRDFRAIDTSLKKILKSCDLIIPLVAIATPKTYVTDPIGVFELDFEANLPYVRYCVDNGVRLLFPSTSEVYGLTDEELFEEKTTRFTYGPIQNERWIYACCKQLLDRIIFAYGERDNLNYTIFRPFNWIGPGIDKISDEEGISRLVSQLLSDVIFRKQITLVDGGLQKRSFTDIRDGIEALVRIVEEPEVTNRKIYNIGNPANECSVLEFSKMLLGSIEARFPHFQSAAVKLIGTTGLEFYGKGYQDVSRRVPNITAANIDLDWKPVYPVIDSIKEIIDGLDQALFTAPLQ
jgi:nucleoside-diphosphate-sugar epimerase